MPHAISAFVSVLIQAAATSTVLLLACLAFDRWHPRRSSERRARVMTGAVASALAVLVLSAALAPASSPCAGDRCGAPAAPGTGTAERGFMFGAAGKFRDIATSQVEAPAPAPTGGTDWLPWAALVWLGGFLIAASAIVRRHVASAQLVASATPLTSGAIHDRLSALAAAKGVSTPVRLAIHPRVLVPSVAGAFRPTVLVPQGIDDAPQEAVEFILQHELAHVRQGDCRAALICEMAVAVFWFNPLVWLASARIRDLQEMAADSRVLMSGAKPSAYAAFLLSTWRSMAAARGPIRRAGLAIVGTSPLTVRLKRILDPSAAHAASTRSFSVLTAVAFGAVSVAVAAEPVVRSWQAPSVSLNHQLLTQEALDRILRPVIINTMTDRYVAGSAIAVVHDGHLVYRAGFGRREVFKEVPVDAERTIWRIGSITKVLTGVAVMQLVDGGRLDLDADVNTYLSAFKVPATFPDPVRIRHLLTHTAGFDQIGLGRQVARAEEIRPLGDFMRENLIRIRPAGQYTTYDTYAITLLGYLVEQVSGLPFEEYLRRQVFAPLGMTRSGILVPPELKSDVAVGYGFAGKWEAERWEFMNTAPASTVNATVADMANFARMLLDGGRFNGRQVLSERSARAMLTRQFTNHPDQPGYGFTFFEDPTFGIPAFSHGGSMAGFGSFLYLVPEHRLGVFVATNQESGVIAQAAVSALVDALFRGHPPARPMLPRTTGSVPLAKFVGRYANSMYHHTDPTRGWRPAPFELTADAQGRLVFNGAPAYAVGPLAFQRDDGVLLTFVEDASGAITRFTVNQQVFERLK
jgi:CubicO group peptidase (beta-lactamase class C family)